MPTYAYQCDKCNHQFDEFQSMKDEPLKKCPKCKRNTLRRLISGGAALLFKGSGFYQTDYRSDSYKAAAKADADKSSGGDKGSSDKGGDSASTGKADTSKAKATPKSSKSPD